MSNPSKFVKNFLIIIKIGNKSENKDQEVKIHIIRQIIVIMLLFVPVFVCLAIEFYLNYSWLSTFISFFPEYKNIGEFEGNYEKSMLFTLYFNFQ